MAFMYRVAVMGGLVIALGGTSAWGAAGPQGVMPPGSAAKGWKQLGRTQVYNSSNLYNLIDGGAQAVLNYAFQACAHGEYAPASANRPALTIDIYQMADPLNAYGLFGSDRMSGSKAPFGAEGVRIGTTALNFWKGRYVVRTTIFQPTPANRTALEQYTRATAARITGSSARPPVLTALPAGRKAGSEAYVRSNVAGQSFLSNAVQAQYPSYGQGASLFIAQYPSPAGAKNAFTAYRTYEQRSPGLAPVRGLGDEAFRVTDRFAKQVVVAQKGRYVVGAHHFRNSAEAEKLVRQAVAKVH